MPRTARTPRTPRPAAQSDRATAMAQPSAEAMAGGAVSSRTLQIAKESGELGSEGAILDNPPDTVTVPREEYDSLRRRSIELDHALARESQRPPVVEPEKLIEHKFRCKLCAHEFKSFDKRPPCPFRCSYSYERRTAHGDYITTEVIA